MSDWIDADDAPPLTRAFFERGERRVGDKIVKPATGTLTRAGRPPLGKMAKQQVTLRRDSDIIERFRAEGAGWQSRMNAALRKAARLA